LLFGTALFLSAALLFLVQLMIGKMILPIFGGVPAVWNTCMVFFQAALLAGYAYSHASVTWLGSRRQAGPHVAVLLLPLLVLPISISPTWAPTGSANPVAPLLALLVVSVGLPFFVVATSAPLLQKWFAESAHGASDPYVLYAASNAGSMLGLLAYPVLIEPYLSLRLQSLSWMAGYGVLIALSIACAVILWRSAPLPLRKGQCDAVQHTQGAGPQALPTAGTRWRWLAYSFVPSSLLLGVTTYLTTDVAPVPLLWVIPLVIYLLTFILVFGGAATVLRRFLVFALPPVLLLQTGLLVSEETRLGLLFGVLLLTFFVVAMVCHGELGRSRPPARFLTEFYLWISAGGALGGLFNALVAPFVFSSVIEYPLVLVLAALLMPPLFPGAATGRFRWPLRVVPVALAVAVGGTLLWHAWTSGASQGTIHRERSFFSVLKVLRGSRGVTHTFVHGNVRHGIQNRSPDPRQRRLPLLYYFPTGPIGQVFQALRAAKGVPPVAIVGLGIGSLASYGEKNQELTFFEIDPAVERIARGPNYFTYLSDAEARGAQLRVELGDARISLRREPEKHYGLFVVDAFSGDAIPTHLLTQEAIQLYQSKLKEDGMLAFHITNNYLDLKPVLAAQARAAGLVALVQDDQPSDEEARRNKAPSTWVVMARQTSDLVGLAVSPRWRSLQSKPGPYLWTDDYSSIFRLLSWQ
jgi:hypothetical protein